MDRRISLDKYHTLLGHIDSTTNIGKVTQVIGLTIEARGPAVEVGEICKLYNLKNSEYIPSEVVGFREDRVLLMPLGDTAGIGPGSRVVSTNKSLMQPVGEQLIGRILDGLGNPIDGKGPIQTTEWVPTQNIPPDPLSRRRINNTIALGIKAIDALLTCGQGQRVGIFAGSGVGKSTLLGMIARNSEADVNVIALIGERGREVREFIEKDLEQEGLEKSIIIVATSDQPALVRVKASLAATAVAEYFREKGKNTILMMDSLTRFAMAQREVGLAIGEPPVARGYTPSVFALLPKLLERTGNSGSGFLTGLYTVLVDGDDLNEPISDTVRGILDGHIVLSRDLANRNHYPAIDILASVSRVMPDIVSNVHLESSRYLKKLLAAYVESQDLIKIGAYQKGSDLQVDEAISKIGLINDFLQQTVEDNIGFDDTIEWLNRLVSN